jgi:hypothetical protein
MDIRCKYFKNCEQSEKVLKNCRYCVDYQQQLKKYITDKINYSWYRNAKIDYDVDGHCLSIDFCNDDMIITHEENGQELKTVIAYYWDYTPEQLYNIWMEEDWQEVA